MRGIRSTYYSGLAAILLLASSPAIAGMSLTTGVMALTNSTKQGGQGARGSTILTESQLMYMGSFWGLGGYFEYDRHGKNQVDTAAGPKLELGFYPLFIEGGYAAFLQRAYTDRSIANQRGSGFFGGAGMRFYIAGKGANAKGAAKSGLYVQFKYRYRTQQIKKQDGVALDERLTQVDGYPLFGLGFEL